MVKQAAQKRAVVVAPVNDGKFMVTEPLSDRIELLKHTIRN